MVSVGVSLLICLFSSNIYRELSYFAVVFILTYYIYYIELKSDINLNNIMSIVHEGRYILCFQSCIYNFLFYLFFLKKKSGASFRIYLWLYGIW